MINKAILIGYIGKDVKMEERPGYKQAIVNLATTKTYKKNGVKESKTVWHLVYFYNALADVVNTIAKKGSMVYVEGSIDNKSWKDTVTGQYKSMSKIIANEFRLLDSKKEKPQNGNSYESNEGLQERFNGNKIASNINTNVDYFENDLPY